MNKKNINPIIKWWVGSNLPVGHIFIPSEKRPKEVNKIIRVYFRKWTIHPLKRRIAKYYLLLLRRVFGLKVVGITGSAGKTSTKEVMASVLSQDGETVASYKNIDPVYNIPSTILRCRPSTRYLVLEMAVEFNGEMDFYLWLATPDVGVLTNVYPTHTEFFGNRRGVFEEKVKLIKSLPGSGAAVLYSESKLVKKAASGTDAEVIFYGKGGKVRAEKRKINDNLTTNYTLVVGKDKKDVQFPLIGGQFINNSLAAASVGYYFGMPVSKITKGLTSFKKPEHRMDIRKHASGAIIIDDSYNNNPEAAKEAIRVLLKVFKNKEKVIVFGDMLELGKLEKKYHRQLGKFMAEGNIDHLIGVGEASKLTVSQFRKQGGKAKWARDIGEAYKFLDVLLGGDAVVLIKGSRSIGLDKLVDRLFR